MLVAYVTTFIKELCDDDDDITFTYISMQT